MAGFTKGQLKAEFSATGIGFADEKATPELENVKLSKELAEEDPQQLKSKAYQDRQKEIELNTAKKEGGAHSIGKIETAQDQSYKLDPEKQRKKDKEFAKFLTRLQEQRIEFERQINWTIHYFEQKAAEAAAQADGLREKIVDNTERMMDNSNFIGAVDKLLKAHKSGEPFDKEKLRKLLKGQGADVDDNTPLPLLLQTAEKMLVQADDENKHLEVDNDIYDKDASKLEALSKGYSVQATELKLKLDALKTQGLSEEEYEIASAKILEGLPLEVRQEYEKEKGVFSEADNGIIKEDISKSKEEVTIDPMAMMDEMPNEELKQSNRNTTVPLPNPNGM